MPPAAALARREVRVGAFEDATMRAQTHSPVRFQRNSFSRHRRSRHGAAVVELAFTAPILFLLCFGMIDVGRAVMVQNLITNAARDGARTAVLDGATAGAIESQVEAYLASSTISDAVVTVSPNPLTLANLGDAVSVTVEVPFDSVSWLPSSMYFQGTNLQATVVMRREVSNGADVAEEEL
jgi:Flp pilus assembly protein TadG